MAICIYNIDQLVIINADINIVCIMKFCGDCGCSLNAIAIDVEILWIIS